MALPAPAAQYISSERRSKEALSETKQRVENLSRREKFIQSASKGKVLLNKCTNCGHLMLETLYFCENCFGNKFEDVELDGIGRTVTYTIQSVAPAGFEDMESYAWVVFEVDNAQVRVSGFLPGVKSAKDLPIGAKVKVSGFDSKHGLSLQKI